MFNEFAPAYFEYMAKAYYHNLPTVLCKILGISSFNAMKFKFVFDLKIYCSGVYTVRYHNKETGKRVVENVVTMENIFYKRNITRTFDLKGSSRARYVELGPEQKLDTFDEVLLKRRRERKKFLSSMHSVRREACFKVLRSQRKKRDNRHRMEAMRRNEILESLRNSMPDMKDLASSSDVEEFLKFEEHFEPHNQLKINQVLLDDNLMELTRGRPFPLKHKAKLFFHRAVLNDTLFLSIVNVVDYSILVGFDENSHEIVVGIIDYLRQYDIVKRMERMGKSGILSTGGMIV